MTAGKKVKLVPELAEMSADCKNIVNSSSQTLIGLRSGSKLVKY
jgi:hypothetical protein